MKIVDLLGGQAEYYLNHTCKTIDKQLIHIPGPDMIDKVWMNSDRNIRTLESLQALYGHGRLAVSIRPRACFFPLFSFLPLWLHYNLNPLCVQY